MLLKFNTHPLGSINTRNTATGQVKTRTTASWGSQSGTMSNPRGASANIDMYNPIYDRLDEGSIIEDWIPRDAAGLNQMFSLMYNRDPYAGAVVDIIADLIWDDFELTGIEDQEIKKVYYDCLTNMNIVSALPGITKEFLVLGRSINSMIWDKSRGIFTDLISHDQSFVRITPIPVYGFDPKLDLIASPGLRKFLESNDARDLDAKQALPTNYIKQLMAGNQGTEGVPLDPISTLFLPRRTFNYDYIGTSLYTRLISFWALEKALINATMSAARRRAGPILHVKAGIENQWRPSDAELSEIAGLFLSADQDPVGAVVTTRNGIDTQEVRSGTDIYKWSDEWQMLTEGKMRALGANESLLSGEATYSNQETARTFLMEKAGALRDTITNRLFYRKLFPLIARLHGFVKSKDGIKSGVKPTQREVLSIPESELIMPTIRWKKDLAPASNSAKLDLMEKLEEKGVPITIKNWASAGGINLSDQITELQLDAELRRKINEYRQSYNTDPAVEAQKHFVNSLRNLSTAGVKKQLRGLKNNLGSLNEFPFWDRDGAFAGVTAKDMNKVVGHFDPNSNEVKRLLDPHSLRRLILEKLNHEDKAAIAHYLMFRTGFTPMAPALTAEQLYQITGAVEKFATEELKDVPKEKLIEIVNAEIKTIKSCDANHKKAALESLQSLANKIHSGDGLKGKNLFSGI